MNIQPYFNPIRKHILSSLKNANTHIAVAVCWFTNEDLFSMLCEKLKKGVIVELIILDDYINSNPYGCDFTEFLKLGGHLYLSDVEKPMHNKYCIIDNQILINGSYNWTYYAEERNEENIIIFEDCKELLSAFQADFDRLKTATKEVTTFNKKSLLEFSNVNKEDTRLNVFDSFNILSNDLFLKAVSTNKQVYYEAAKKITPDNISFQKEGIRLNWEKPIKLNSTLAESIKDDKLSIIFPIGTLIPIETTLDFNTIKDEQEEASMTLYAGENELASKNRKIGNYLLVGIPPLKAGEGKIKTNYKISTSGILYITNRIHDTGLVVSKTYDLKKYNLLVNE